MKHRRPALPQPGLHVATAAKQQGSAAQFDASPQLGHRQLVALFDAGHYAELESRARVLVEHQPHSGFAWKILGVALKVQGKNALLALIRAANLLPEDAEAHNNLGNAWRDLGHLNDSVASCHRALAIKPDFAEAHSNLGNAQRDLGRLDDAVDNYRRALACKPDYAEAHSNLGNVLTGLGRLDVALASCRRALEIWPDFAEAHNNLGNALKDLGRLDLAIASYRRSLEIRPAYAEAQNNLGNAQRALGHMDDAVASYRRALAVKPDFSEAHSNLGNILTDLGRLDGAVASCRRALAIRPDFAEAHSNLLFTYSYMSDQPASALLSEARRYGDMVARQARPYADWQNSPDTTRCLRVGWVSGDLRNHPVGYFVEGMFAALACDASSRLEFFAYPTDFQTDALSERIKTCCRGWHSVVGLSDERLAERIRDDGIDILIDLSGHTAHNRLPMFAWKPAPIQVSWLGYFATTGVAGIDYVLADPWTLPATEEISFTEKIWRLPKTRLCFTPPEVDVPVSPLPALTSGHITFGCFNNLAKMNDAVVALWARVMQTVAGSRLLLKAKQLGETSQRQRVIDHFFAHGIDTDRLTLEGKSPRTQYFSAYNRVDIALDPFPFTGGTTSAESLWMGVPVLTLAGDSFLSRQGLGMMTNAGLADWVVTDADDYIACARLHAADLERLAALRGGLRQQVLASPIFDVAQFAKHFEAALHDMWAQWCRQQRLIP